MDTATNSASILPIASTVSAGAVSEQEVTQYVNTAGTLTIGVVDADGDPIDVSGVTSWRFVAYSDDENRDTVYTITEDNITVGGANDNQVAVTYDETDTATEGTFRWNLRDEDTPRLLGHGALNIEFSKDVT
jgi:hypothetical protein